MSKENYKRILLQNRNGLNRRRKDFVLLDVIYRMSSFCRINIVISECSTAIVYRSLVVVE